MICDLSCLDEGTPACDCRVAPDAVPEGIAVRAPALAAVAAEA
jgi:hypothetical protein